MVSLAELLRELKERSGLSYGVLAKRLRVSTSTLHRYCNGDAVPAEFASVERFARLCEARPEELVEVHRRWILADAERRGRKPEPTTAATSVSETQHRPVLATASTSPSPLSPSRRRRALALAATVAAVIGITSVTLAMNANSDDDKHRQKGPAPDASRDGAHGENPGIPLTARTRPYAYEEECLQNFLVNRKPDEVPARPAQQDQPGWVADLGAVSAGSQHIEVTVQGMGKDTVVLQSMNVRVQSTGAPPAWNIFQMGSGCGGKVRTKAFNVDLDEATPRVTHKDDQRDFPYKVSENDPAVFYITATTDVHDVRWYLELKWSSGKRHDVLRVDDQGKPFRTSGKEERPKYSWWPSDGWLREQDG